MTLEEMCAATLARDPASSAIEYDGQWVRWGEMRRIADQVSALVAASGAAAHAPIAFAPRTRPSGVAALLALIAGGHTVRMVYVFQSAAGIIRDVDKRAPALLISAAEDFSEELIEALRQRGIAGIALSETGAEAVAGIERSTAAVDPNVPPRHVETLTSGTTGAPKQFLLGFDMLAEHLVGQHSSIANDDSAEVPVYLPAPLGNISGIYGVLPNTIHGRRIVLVDRFSVGSWCDFVRRFRPRFTSLPAAGVQMVLDADVPREDLASIEALSIGAAPLAPSVHRAFEARYGIPILLAYGATEFAGPATAMTMELHIQFGEAKFGSVGRAVHGTQLRTIDPDTGEVQGPGETGVLEVIAPRMGNDWIRTSDLARIDEDGFMYHCGRVDGAIVRGGFKILPETIERALIQHDAVSAAVVVGIPDRRLGQVPAAAIEVKPGAEPPTPAELETHLRANLLATHIPTRWLILDALPRTPSVKFDRGAVKRLFEEAAA